MFDCQFEFDLCEELPPEDVEFEVVWSSLLPDGAFELLSVVPLDLGGILSFIPEVIGLSLVSPLASAITIHLLPSP